MPKANILLVDDRAANLLALEALLAPLDQNVVKAGSGEEALRYLLDKDFALILMDVQMPGMDGFETATLIHSRDRSRHTPIIFLTAVYRTDVEIYRGYSLGAVDYLFKPIIPEILRSKVAVFVELYRKTEQIKRQAEQLRENERLAYEKQLSEEKQQWEMERLRQEAAREKRIAEGLAEADRRKDEFLALLAHELRNPLAPILNALHILRLHVEDDPDLERVRAMAERQVQHMSRLIDDLLDVSRINRGTIRLRREPVEVGALVKRTVEALGQVMEVHHHELHVELPCQPVWLDADPLRLDQILTNLLTNAAKYTPPGGRIDVSAERDGDSAVLRVRDNGLGIPSDMLESIFGLFTQIERTLASSSQWGLGIGLALVRNLVELHGGSVRAFSEGPDRGSEFVVRLPGLTSPAPPCTETRPEASNGEESRPARVLVVDDNKDAAVSLSLVLEIRGHEVHLAHDGPSAIERAVAVCPDVILLDIGLPGLDGYEVARRLRQHEETRGALLVAMTGYGQEEDRRRSAAAGFDHHLVKPVEPGVVEELLAGALV